MIRDYQALQRTWFEKGKQRIIQTTGKHRGVKLLSTVDYCTGKVVWQEHEDYNAETFLIFLHKVLEAYPTGNNYDIGQRPYTSWQAVGAIPERKQTSDLYIPSSIQPTAQRCRMTLEMAQVGCG